MILAFLLSGCGHADSDTGDAVTVLTALTAHFEMKSGVIYGDGENDEHILTDAMLDRMFSDGQGLPEFAYVVSRAAYFSRRFSEEEIVVLKLCDRSHRGELMTLLRRRAAKKENAVVYADGVYVYLICTDRNEEIVKYLK